MQCPKCGSQNTASANFCRACGNKLKGSEEIDAEEPRKTNVGADHRGQKQEERLKNWRDRLGGTVPRRVRTIAVTATVALAFLAYFAVSRGKLEIELSSIASRNGLCEVGAHVTNNTQHHLETVGFTIGSWQLAVKQAYPPNTEAFPVIGTIDPTTSKPLRTCQDIAKDLRENRSRVSVTSCSMRNVTEGDCRDLVFVNVPWNFRVDQN